MISPSLQAAGIMDMQEAKNRLARCGAWVNSEKPQLIVHLVNWYAYHPEDMRRTLYWNGDAGKGTDRVVLQFHPLLGYYNCDDPDYMDWVVKFSQALGVTELNIDYEGGVDYPPEFSGYYSRRFWDRWFPRLLSRAESSDLKISVMYEPKSILGRLAVKQGMSPADTVADPGYDRAALEVLKDDLRKICNRFTVKTDANGRWVMNPAYCRLNGLPVIWIFHITASRLTREIWAQAVQDLQAQGYAFVLVGTTNWQADFDEISQGINPWVSQLFAGFKNQYPELWQKAQTAASRGDADAARQAGWQYIQELSGRGLQSIAPIRVPEKPGNFTVAPVAIGFQDAGVNAWDLRNPVYLESQDRTRTDPGLLFKVFFQTLKTLKQNWNLVCSGDDICEGTHMLIPDEEHGFSGPLAIAEVAKHLGKHPDILQAIELTGEFIRKKNNHQIPEHLKTILEEAKQELPAKLK